MSECVTVRCNQCGEEYCFHPQTVAALRACKCGNDNWGSPRNWDKDDFGDFTLVGRDDVVYAIPTPFGDWKFG